MQLCLLLISLLVSNLQAQEPPGTQAAAPQVPYVEREEKQFTFYPGGKLEIFTGVPGSVKIVGWQKGSVRLEAEKIIYYLPREKAQALMQKSPIRVRYSQTSATIQTPGSPEPPAAIEINLTLYVPGEKTDLNIRMDRGDLSMDSINGWIEATIGQGSMEARSLAGYFSCTTQRGDLYAEMSGNHWRGLEFAALTQQGSAELRLPADYSASLQLEARNGTVVVDYPPRIVEGESIRPEIVTKKTAQSLKAAVGDGGSPVRLVTYSGDVKLSVKKEK